MEFEGSDGLVLDLVDTPEFQRLRRIKQIGLAHLVYPGAEHSRFTHSLGAAFLALRIGRLVARAAEGVITPMLWPRRENIRDLAIAALCHDLGHGPYSHAWEREVMEGANLSKWADALGIDRKYVTDDLRWHELVTLAIIGSSDSALNRKLTLFDAALPDRVIAMLTNRYYLPFLSRVISSDIDVDRIDFMIRDAHHCGLAHGRFDLDRLLSTIVVGDTDGGVIIGFDREKATSVVEQFMIARRALYEIVYYHKTVRSAEMIVGLFFKRLRELAGSYADSRSLDPLIKRFARVASGKPVGLEDLLLLDDYSMMALVAAVERDRKLDPTLRDLARRLLVRDLLRVARVKPEKAIALHARHAAEIDRAVAKALPGLNPHYLWEIDRGEVRMFETAPEKQAFFISGHSAIAIQNVEPMRGFKPEREFTRLFVAEEAREAVERIAANA